MKENLLMISCFLLIIGCSQSAKEEGTIREESATSTVENPETDPVQPEASTAVLQQSKTARVSEQKGEKAAVDFLSACDALEIWKGAIQGVPAGEAGGTYIMAQCFANRHFDLIVYSNRNLELGEAADNKKGTIKPGLPDAEYYAFEIPKKEAEETEAEGETFDYVFPSQVKVYKRFDDGWYQINQQKVTTFEQLGRLKLNTVRKRTTS